MNARCVLLGLAYGTRFSPAFAGLPSPAARGISSFRTPKVSGAREFHFTMDELKESSYLFSLKQLERMEGERKRSQSHRLAVDAAARKRRESEQAEERVAMEKRLANASLMTSIATEGAQSALAGQKAAIVEAEQLKVTLAAEKRLHAEQLELSRSHAATLVTARFSARTAVLKWLSGLSVAVALTAFGVGALAWTQARAGAVQMAAEYEGRLSAERTEKARLSERIREVEVKRSRLVRTVSRLKQDLATATKSGREQPPKASTQPRRARANSTVTRPRGSALRSSHARCKAGSSGDPLNPCLP